MGAKIFRDKLRRMSHEELINLRKEVWKYEDCDMVEKIIHMESVSRLNMRMFHVGLKHNGNGVMPIVMKDRVLKNNILMLVRDDASVYEAEAYAHCSPVLEYELSNEDLVLIKTYSENSGLLEWLVENKVILDVVDVVDNGFATYPICKLNIDLFRPCTVLD